MGKMIATCGHEVNSDIRPIAVKKILSNGINVISWQVLCKQCIADYFAIGLILVTEEEQLAWLRGEGKLISI